MVDICIPGLEVIKPEYSLRLKIKRNDWLLADTIVRNSQSLRFILSLRMNSSLLTSSPGVPLLWQYDKVHWSIQSKHKQLYNTFQIGTFEGFVIILDVQYWMSTHVICINANADCQTGILTTIFHRAKCYIYTRLQSPANNLFGPP